MVVVVAFCSLAGILGEYSNIHSLRKLFLFLKWRLARAHLFHSLCQPWCNPWWLTGLKTSANHSMPGSVHSGKMENEEFEGKQNSSNQMLLENVLFLAKTNCNQASITHLEIRQSNCTVRMCGSGSPSFSTPSLLKFSTAGDRLIVSNSFWFVVFLFFFYLCHFCSVWFKLNTIMISSLVWVFGVSFCWSYCPNGIVFLACGGTWRCENTLFCVEIVKRHL